MRWSVVRLITAKEFRDLLRDRRTVMLILVLPAILYPLFGTTGYLFALTLSGQSATIGIQGREYLPDESSKQPPLFDGDTFAEGLDKNEESDDLSTLILKDVSGNNEKLLRDHTADVILTIPKDFQERLSKAAAISEENKPSKPIEPPVIDIDSREGDDAAKLAAKRVNTILRNWEKRYREARFDEKKLPKNFDDIFIIKDSLTDKPREKRAADELRDTFAKVFPLLLVMWLVAGAIQPAVDMTAGEKERGTMETLLISPAERIEIVLGKFFATTMFAFASVVWNVLWLTGGALIMSALLKFPVVSLPGLAGCVVLGLPMALFFSAVCIALGVFAKSTKEGQYYLMPLLLVTLPLTLIAMAPGAELSPLNCWVPVTGVDSVSTETARGQWRPGAVGLLHPSSRGATLLDRTSVGVRKLAIPTRECTIPRNRIKEEKQAEGLVWFKNDHMMQYYMTELRVTGFATID